MTRDVAMKRCAAVDRGRLLNLRTLMNRSFGRSLFALVLAAIAACGGAGHDAASGHATVTPREDNGQGAETAPATEATSAAPSRPQGRDPRDDERAFVDELSAQVETLRGLPFKHPVRVRVQTADEMTANLEAHLRESLPPTMMQIYAALGLIPDGADAVTLMRPVLMEQVLGYYDPREDYLAVRSAVMDALVRGARNDVKSRSDARATLAHELVHALVDQYYDLSQVPSIVDAQNAFSAVVEGDASLTMLASEARFAEHPLPAAAQGVIRLAETSGDIHRALGADQHQPALLAAPAIVREPLLSTYLDGMVYVAYLVEKGDTKRLDKAYARAPETMAEVLHPQRPRARGSRDAGATEPLDPHWLRALGRTELAQQRLGEIEFRVFLSEQQTTVSTKLGGRSAHELAAEWLWDDLRLLGPSAEEGRPAVVWYVTLRSAEAARDVAARVSAPCLAMPRGRSALVACGLSAQEWQHLSKAARR